LLGNVESGDDCPISISIILLIVDGKAERAEAGVVRQGTLFVSSLAIIIPRVPPFISASKSAFQSRRPHSRQQANR
jgi:hypothetical protein